MLFVTILTWNPENRNEIVQRRAEKGAMIPEGITVVGEWGDLSGCRDVIVFETDDADALLMDSMNWNDLIKMGTFPAMEAEKVMSEVS